MSRKTYSIETFYNMHIGLLSKGLEKVGHKVFHHPEAPNKMNDVITRTRIMMIYSNITNKVSLFCPLDNGTIVELTEDEAEMLLFAYEVYHWFPYGDTKSPNPVRSLTDYEKEETDKLYKSLSGHEANDSYEWIKYPYGLLTGHGGVISYNDYRYSM